MLARRSASCGVQRPSGGAPRGTAGRGRALSRGERPASTIAPASWTRRASSAASLVLPIPASPASTTIRPLAPPGEPRARAPPAPRAAARGRPHRAASSAISCARPISGACAAAAQFRRQLHRRRALARIPARAAPSPPGSPPVAAGEAAARGPRSPRPTGRAELVAQQHSQPVEHAQPLGDVASHGQRLHQQHVAGLAIRLGLDQRSRRPLGRLQLRAAHHQPGAADHLERLQAHVLELAAWGLEPGRLGAREQAAAGDVERHLRERPRAAGVVALERVDARARPRPPPPRRRSRPARGASRISSSRPASAEDPSDERNRESSVRSAASWETGGWSGHSAPISSSRPTCRARFSTRYASSSGTCRPRSRSESCTPSISTDSRPQSWIRVISRARSACGNVLETYRQRDLASCPTVSTEVSRSDALGGARLEVSDDQVDDGLTTKSTEATGGLPTASAGRYSQATTSRSSSKRLNGTSHTTIRSSWGRWGRRW